MAQGLEALRSSRSFELRRIHFVPARHPDAHSAPVGVGLVALNDPIVVSDMPGVLSEREDRAVPSPSTHNKELFREEAVTFAWREVRRTGPGLNNLGNTCFMNSVLQCLTHTAPLAETLLDLKGYKTTNGFDPLRLTQEHIINSLRAKHRVISPVEHAKSLRKVNRSFRLGRQEDAHEYLIALLDAMHESFIQGMTPKPSLEVQQTSLIYRIFGGRIRSQVKCCECGYESNTYDPFLDVSLDIHKSQTVQRALERFTERETLDRDNKYKCPKQKKLVKAYKRMTLDKAPRVLVLQLKRFEFSMFGHKIGRKVDFETLLDVGPYLSSPPKGGRVYELYAVLVHSGHSVHSGHYYCYVRASNGIWHLMDDSRVQQVSEKTVLDQRAYMLFYTLRQDSKPCSTTHTTQQQQQQAAPTAVTALTVPTASQPSSTTHRTQQQQQQAAPTAVTALTASQPSSHTVGQQPQPNGVLARQEEEQAMPEEAAGKVPRTRGGSVPEEVVENGLHTRNAEAAAAGPSSESTFINSTVPSFATAQTNGTSGKTRHNGKNGAPNRNGSVMALAKALQWAAFPGSRSWNRVRQHLQNNLQVLTCRWRAVLLDGVFAAASNARSVDSSASTSSDSYSLDSSPPVSAASWPPIREDLSRGCTNSPTSQPGHQLGESGDAERATAARQVPGGCNRPTVAASAERRPPLVVAAATEAADWLGKAGEVGGVGRWEDGNGVTPVAAGMASSVLRPQQKRKTKYDEYEAEYDKGRVKKVKTRDQKLLFGEHKLFQQHFQRRQHFEGNH